jgi:ribokinase
VPEELPTRPSILVVGSVNMDLVLQLPRMPLLGESMVGHQYSRIPGGKGANQAVGLARLGAKVTLAGKVGKDADGATLLGLLKQQGVATDYVIEAEGSSTGLAVIFLDATGQNSVAVFPGANYEITEDELRTVFAADKFDAVMMQLEVPDQVVIATYRFAEKSAIPVFLDAGPARPFPLEQLWGIDLLSPNETEVTALTGIEVKSLADAERAAAKLMTRSGAKAVVIKLGSQGALLRTADGQVEQYRAPQVEAIDTTAAGDAFTAALLVRYLETGDFREAVPYANFAGALATTRLGAQPSLPTAEEIERQRGQWQPRRHFEQDEEVHV